MNIPIIALSQLSRGVEIRNNKRPLTSDLRDSGNLEQDADIILLQYSPSAYYTYSTMEQDPEFGEPGSALFSGTTEDEFKLLSEMRVAKNRSGKAGRLRILEYFFKDFSKFQNASNVNLIRKGDYTESGEDSTIHGPGNITPYQDDGSPF